MGVGDLLCGNDFRRTRVKPTFTDNFRMTYSEAIGSIGVAILLLAFFLNLFSIPLPRPSDVSDHESDRCCTILLRILVDPLPAICHSGRDLGVGFGYGFA